MLDQASGVYLNNFVRLLKHKRLSEEDVIEHISHIAKEIHPALIGIETDVSSDLEELVINLPEEYIANFINNDEKAVSCLKEIIQLPSLPNSLRTRYLDIGCGVIPSDILNTRYKTVDEFDDAVQNYNVNIKRGMDFSVELMIENDSLPDKNLIMQLIHHGVREADKFIITGSRYINHKNLKFIINSVYEALTDKRKLRLLVDSTEGELERECIAPLQRLVSYFLELEDCRARRHKQIEEIKRNRIKDLLDGNKGTGNSGVN